MSGVRGKLLDGDFLFFLWQTRIHEKSTTGQDSIIEAHRRNKKREREPIKKDHGHCESHRQSARKKLGQKAETVFFGCQMRGAGGHLQ